MKLQKGVGVGSWLTEDNLCEIAEATPSWAVADIRADGTKYRAVVIVGDRSSTAIGKTPIAAWRAAAIELEENWS